MQIKHFLDDTGSSRALLIPHHEMLRDFLEVDLGWRQWADEILEKIKLVRGGQQPQEQTGNAYNVEIDLSWVTIDCLWDDLPATTLSLDDFEAVVTQWRNFLAKI